MVTLVWLLKSSVHPASHFVRHDDDRPWVSNLACALCAGATETIDHLFVGCPIAVDLWQRCAFDPGPIPLAVVINAPPNFIILSRTAVFIDAMPRVPVLADKSANYYRC